MDYMLQTIYRAFLPLHILHHADETPVDLRAVVDEMARHGYNASDRAVSRALRRLKDEGLLVPLPPPGDGEEPGAYGITPKGRAALARARPALVAQMYELLGERPANEAIAG